MAGLDPEEKAPFSRLLEGLVASAAMRFEPYQNDDVPNFVEKLSAWIEQFDEDERAVAFLLAVNVLFVTQRQYEALQRRLFEAHIRRHLLDGIIREKGLPPLSFRLAMRYLAPAMDETLFVANSDSSPLNSFVHVNHMHFRDREKRRLTGPEVRFWVYPSQRRRRPLKPGLANVAERFELEILNSDERLAGKRRMVVLEDFSGTGSDILGTLGQLHGSALSLEEIVVAVVMATEHAIIEIERSCRQLNATGCRRYSLEVALRLPQKLRCFDGPEPWFYAAKSPIPAISSRLRAISDRVHNEHLSSLVPEKARYGFGKLALAFAFHANCPDNTLPMIWAPAGRWKPLFRRVSRLI